MLHGFRRYAVLNLLKNCADLPLDLADTLILLMVSVSVRNQCSSRSICEEDRGIEKVIIEVRKEQKCISIQGILGRLNENT